MLLSPVFVQEVLLCLGTLCAAGEVCRCSRRAPAGSVDLVAKRLLTVLLQPALVSEAC